jgi:hypothetical protein
MLEMSSSKWQPIEPPRLVISSPPSPTGSSRSGGTPKQSFSLTHSQTNLVETKWKGKGRAKDDDDDEEDITDMQNNNIIYDEHTEDEGSEYPPVGDDQLEERRVQEVSNLLSWLLPFHPANCSESNPQYLDPQALGGDRASAPENNTRIRSLFPLCRGRCLKTCIPPLVRRNLHPTAALTRVLQTQGFT